MEMAATTTTTTLQGGGGEMGMAVETTKTTLQGVGEKEKAVVDDDDQQQKVSFYKLFLFADKMDVVLMIVGTIGAIGNGVSQPLMTLLFGQLINSFGSSIPSNVIDEVSQVMNIFIHIGNYLSLYIYIRVCLRSTPPTLWSGN